ncbi:MAG: GTPase [Bacteroidota bacterium]|nr:GTPase [Bacteroidota bacterium]
MILDKKQIRIEDYISGVTRGDRAFLAKSITLKESVKRELIGLSHLLLSKLMHLSGKSIRICITGAPGVGKSSFIESFGSYMCDIGHKVAVLAIDPSSSLSRGSILGDKTRMENLSRNENAFIRPSPSGGTLGGVAKKTRESIILCEAAGYDIILIETIGVGQSEITARSMTDFFLLLLSPGSGDELQGIKKGSVELSDCIVINKADGMNIENAGITKHNYENALHLINPVTTGWSIRVLTCSAYNNQGIPEIWQIVEEFSNHTKSTGVFEERRNNQLLDWFNTCLEDELKDRFYANSKVSELMKNYGKKVLESKISPAAAAEKILKIIDIKI